jgi:hypothetical protein
VQADKAAQITPQATNAQFENKGLLVVLGECRAIVANRLLARSTAS